MLFRVCEHYDDNQQMFQEQDNECFICFEHETDNESKPTNLQKQQLYFNKCLCNGSVHNCCLKIWLEKNKSCPICRMKVIENNNTTIIIYQYFPRGIQIYSLAKNMYVRFIKLCLVIFYFHTLIYFCLLVFEMKYVLYNDTHKDLENK